MDIIERDIFLQIKTQLDNNLALILTGARQVGKTYILKYLEQYISKHFPHQKVFYFNLEDEETLLKVASYKDLLSYLELYGMKKGERCFVLLDEFQRLPHPTKLLKILYDNDPYIKVVATGSSSLEIYHKLRQESLVGRKRLFIVFPLTFAEFLKFQYSQLYQIWLNITPDKINTQLAHSFENSLNQFVVYGGYPRLPFLSIQEKQRELQDIYNSYIQKDITGLLKIEDTTSYTKLVISLAAQSGNLVSVNELSNTLNILYKVVEKYIFTLENTFVIKFIKPFFTNKRKEITKLPKVYFLDIGLRNFALRNFTGLDERVDAGQIIENMAFLELYKNLAVVDEIYFWRTPQGTEVDFILQHNSKNYPIEVKFKSFKKPIIPSGLRAFINHYQPPKGFVLTKDYFDHTIYNNTEIIFLPVCFTSFIFKMI